MNTTPFVASMSRQFSSRAPLLAWLLTVVAAAASAPAQCVTEWLPGGAVPGVSGEVTATTMWDPDGAGPAPEILVVGGLFSSAGSAVANNIAFFDPVAGTWSEVGGGTSGAVWALTVLPNGDLVAAGEFTMAGGVVANGIARWDGVAWSTLGTGMAGNVFALTVLANGDLVAGGQFASAGGVAVTSIARWDGTSWSAVGSLAGGGVFALVTLPSGDLVAGGRFAMADGMPAPFIARWDGVGWSAMGTGAFVAGPLYKTVDALTVLPNGDVVAAGRFTAAGGVRNIARWNGASWSALGSGLTGTAQTTVAALLTLANGDVVAGGIFYQAGGLPVSGIARWDGASWSAMGSLGHAQVFALAISRNGDVVAGGDITGSPGSFFAPTIWNIARWDGTTWSPPSSLTGLDYPVQALATLPNGGVVVGGRFTSAAGALANRIAHWDGTTWSALGLGMNNEVSALTVLPNGDIVAGGRFTMAGGISANYLARWDGASWSTMGDPSGRVSTLMTLPNGDVVAGGRFTTIGGVAANRIARWDGLSWSPLGTGMNHAVQTARVLALHVLPNGDLLAGGFFTTSGGVSTNNMARWDGASWSAMGDPNGRVSAMMTLPNGDLIVAGNFFVVGGVPASRIARWDGATWSALGSGVGTVYDSVWALMALPNGDVVAGGNFTIAGSFTVNGVARWDGVAWSAFDSGVIGAGYPSASVSALAALPNGNVLMGGEFLIAGGYSSAYLAQLTTTCPATAPVIATSCIGPAGPLVLVPDSLPWLGSTFRSTATGFASSSVGVALLGWSTQNLPLATLHPAGLPNCDLLTAVDVTQVVLPSAGGASSYQIPIPNDPVFAGVQLFHQLVQVELSASGALLSLSSSNGLALTIGTF